MSTIKNKDLKKRITNISYKKGLSHLGSVLTAVDIIKEIYDTKKEEDIFILSAGHAGLALYVVLEEKYGFDAEELFEKHGVHPNRDIDNKIYCSSGSLGHGIGIAVGAALANRDRNVYCLISDGECAEGSVWEALRIRKEQNLNNLRICVNINSYGAYHQIDNQWLKDRLWSYESLRHPFHIYETNFDILLPILREPQEAHYVVLDKDKYDIVMKALD